jgi:hypothetical protein
VKRKPLQRRTGLKTNTPLRASKPMRRDAAVPGKSPVNPVKPKSRKREPGEVRARAVVRARSGGMCEIAIPGVCLGRATNYSHRVNASQGGEYAAASALDACGSGVTGCHGWLHANPAGAYANGWLVKSWDDPLARPVVRRGQWVVLDNEGGYTPALDSRGAA